MVERIDKTYLYDGIKTSLWGGVEDGWVISGGYDEQTKDISTFWKAIPWMFRGTTLRADNIAKMPFAIVRGEDEFDVSTDYQNKVGFLPDLPSLLWLIEASLVLTGKAYLWREYNALTTKSLRYIAPQSISYEVDKSGKVVFKRDLGSGSKEVDPKAIVYFWLHDPFVELGAASSFPGSAALSASGVLFNVDAFAAAFFKRGAVKATIFQAQGMGKEEREQFLTWWGKMVTGIKNAFTTKIINAEKMQPVVIGEGLESLQNIELTDDKKKDIASAFGIPFAILFSDAANYATAQQDKLNFLDNTIVPECRFLESILNEQIFTPLGLHFEFREESLDAFQVDEQERAQSLKTYIDAGFPLLMACDLLGVELSDDQRAELVAAEEEKKRKAEEMANALQQAQNKPQAQPGQPAPEKPEDTPVKAELSKWERKAIKALKSGKSANVPFESDIIPDSVSQVIRRGLMLAISEIEVKDLFSTLTIDMDSKPLDITDILAELKAARMALLNEERAESRSDIVVSGPTIKIPDVVIPQPEIKLTMPEQPAPIINITMPPIEIPPANVTVNMPEQPAPQVTVSPKIDVPAPQVTVKMPAEKQGKWKVKRNAGTGAIEGIEEQ